MKLISPESAEIILSTQIGGKQCKLSQPLKKTIRASDGWVEFVGVYHYNNLGNSFVTIYVESSNQPHPSISMTSTLSPGSVHDMKGSSTHQDVYKDYFLIGNAISKIPGRLSWSF